jgi:3-dehydroquinate dehydratase type I
MICVALAEKNVSRCIQLAHQYDLSEIRIDLCEFGTEEVKEVFSCGAQLVATCREGEYSLEKRRDLLILAMQSGARYVDIELESEYGYKMNLCCAAKENNCQIIISYHNFEKTPSLSELQQIVKTGFSYGADIVKIATMVNEPKDNAALMGLYESGQRLIVFGMGEKGKISRIVAPLLGAEFTFAAVDEAGKTAPGQIPVEKLKVLLSMIVKS